MESDYLILRRASAFRPSGEWNDDDYDVLCNGVVVGRIMQTATVQVGDGQEAARQSTRPQTSVVSAETVGPARAATWPPRRRAG